LAEGLRGGGGFLGGGWGVGGGGGGGGGVCFWAVVCVGWGVAALDLSGVGSRWGVFWGGLVFGFGGGFGAVLFWGFGLGVFGGSLT